MDPWGREWGGMGDKVTHVNSTLIFLAFETPSSNVEWCHLSRHVRMLLELVNSTNAHPRHLVGSSRWLRHRMEVGCSGLKCASMLAAVAE